MVRLPITRALLSGWFYGRADAAPPSGLPPVVVESMSVEAMGGGYGAPPMRLGFHDGDKYPGGFGVTELLAADYFTLRARSVQLFKSNLYARGIIRRLVTNIINTGLALEATPDEQILGVGEDELADWAEAVENRFHLWERSPVLCDYKGLQSFGSIQAAAKMAALISGDVLVMLIQDPVTGLPRVRLVDGDRVQSPFGLGLEEPSIAEGNTVKHGVELDADGRHVAFWIATVEPKTGQRKTERLAAMGASGRRLAWLVYGSDRLLDEVRGEPILSLMLQSLREIDRYRDSVQRKAVINAMLAMFIKKDTETLGSRPIMGGATVRGRESVGGMGAPGKPPRTFNTAEMIPGLVLDELAPGESPHGFPTAGIDEKFSDFEAAIVYTMAWALEIPPEILTLSFASNYSASQAAINEFKLYLNPVRAAWGDDFCQPIYVDWLLSSTLSGRTKADGLLAAWRDPAQYDKLAAWVSADWSGAIKPSVDLMKQANGYAMLVEQGFISRDRATRETTGTKFSKNVAKLKRENAALAEANATVAKPSSGAPGPAPAPVERSKPPGRKPPTAALSLVEKKAE
jgi:lambda family phage portal protein